MQPKFASLLFFTFLSTTPFLAAGQTSYANEFVDPDWVVAGDFPANTGGSRNTIVQWANRLMRSGPWSVTSKSATPPSGTKHDYMSWAPYWWPNCSNAGNTTALSDPEIWERCVYERRDGRFNPDVRDVNDVGNFQTMSDAIFYSVLAWSFDNEKMAGFSKAAVGFIQTWFLDEATRMNPNLNYAQQIRGPEGREGSPTGVLDLKGMTKIASSILILRKAKSPDWTSELDSRMIEWSREYINWLETSPLALDEGSAANNHGTFYYNQLASMKLIVNDVAGARNVTSTYFSRQFRSQISANGEQPLEAARTRPYHYRAYNLAAMITNARIEQYADPETDVWNRTSSEGATIKSALDYAMTFSAEDSDEWEYAAELHPAIAAVASVYGDPNGAYLAYLKDAYPGFSSEAYFLWNQAGGWAASEGSTAGPEGSAAPSGTGSNAKPSSSAGAGSKGDDGAGYQTSIHVFALAIVFAPLLLSFGL